jgi:hypothetical protein
MRTRLGLALLALLAIVVFPSEAVMAEQAGSVVDQVSSCRAPSGLLRNADAQHATADGGSCRFDGADLGPTLLLIVFVGLVGAVTPASVTHRLARDERRRPADPDGRARWHTRGPPVAV